MTCDRLIPQHRGRFDIAWHRQTDMLDSESERYVRQAIGVKLKLKLKLKHVKVDAFPTSEAAATGNSVLFANNA